MDLSSQDSLRLSLPDLNFFHGLRDTQSTSQDQSQGCGLDLPCHLKALYPGGMGTVFKKEIWRRGGGEHYYVVHVYAYAVSIQHQASSVCYCTQNVTFQGVFWLRLWWKERGQRTNKKNRGKRRGNKKYICHVRQRRPMQLRGTMRDRANRTTKKGPLALKKLSTIQSVQLESSVNYLDFFARNICSISWAKQILPGGSAECCEVWWKVFLGDFLRRDWMSPKECSKEWLIDEKEEEKARRCRVRTRGLRHLRIARMAATEKSQRGFI